MANMSDKVAEISDPTHHTSLMTSLRTFINTESFVDVQFICQGGHKVFAHKLMLISVSRLLKKLLTENPDSNDMITIHLPDITSKLLRIVVNFLYIGFMRLNSAEMDQFKMVLGLLDIELFQKNPEQENSDSYTVSKSNSNNNNNNNNNNNSSSSVYYASSNVTVPQSVVNASVTVANRLSQPNTVPAEFVPVAQTSTHVPVDSGPQYITIRADQLGMPPNSRGEVLVPYSAVTMQHPSNNIVGQQNTLCLQTAQAVIQQDQNQFNTFTSNVINSPVSATQVSNTSNMVSVNNVGQLPSTQVNVQHMSPLVVQASGQQMVRLVPTAQNQSIVNSNASFSSTKSETSRPGTSNSQNNTKGIKRKSSHRPLEQSSGSDVVIDLSDDDGTDYKKTESVKSTTLNQHRIKQRKSFYSNNNNSGSGGSILSATPSTSSSQPVARNALSSFRVNKNKRKKDGKEIIEVDLEESKANVLNDKVLNRTM